jgi:hypothetical protein
MIDFSNAKVLSYDHSNVYFGELFRYGSRKNIQIQGELYALENPSGVLPIWEGISGFVESAVDYDNILINGVNFGPGRIDSITFDPGLDIRRKNYQVSLTIFNSGNLFNLTGQYYSGLNFNSLPIHLLESFSEEFDFSYNNQKEGTFEQSINVRFVSGAANSGSQNPIQLAKLLASGLINSDPGFPLIISQFAGANVGDKKYVTEFYNHITNECAFTFTSKVYSGVSGYGFTYTHNLNVDQEGIYTVVENGKVFGLQEDLWTNAEIGYDNEFPNAYARSNSVYLAHQGSGTLNSQYLSLGKTSNRIAGLIDYSVSFSDNLNLNDTYIWEYTHDISKAEECIFNVSEKGNIKGRNSDCSSLTNYNNALTAWSSIQTGISGRSQIYYQDATSFTKPLKLVGRSESKSEIRGEISYDYAYTDNQYYSISGFKKIDYTVEDKLPVPLVSKYLIANVKEVVQPAHIATVGNRSVSLQIVGDSSKTITGYINFAKDYLNTLKPTGGDVFINDAKYSFTPLDNIFNIQADWSFFGDKGFTDTSV